MNKYEVMYVLTPQLEDEALETAVNRVSEIITGNGGEIEKTDRWGKRRLAYEVKGFNEGSYILTLFSAPAAVSHELDRLLRISDEVIRYLIVAREE